MKILAIDTSTEACSAALYTDGEIIERFVLAPRKHIELLQPMVKEVVDEAGITLDELTGLAFGAGPGSFAGLRVACSFIQGVGAGLNLPIVPVSTLMAMAHHTLESDPETSVIPMLDAKMHSVYWGIYRMEENQIVTIYPDQVSDLDDIPNLHGIVGLRNLMGAGEGWSIATEWVTQLSPEKIIEKCYPRAGEVALLAIKDLEKGLGLHADQVSPTYLRNNIALTIEEQNALKAKK